MELSERYAYKVWEKQSFSVAAAELFISQPSLSATISRLEKSLGFSIFNRSTIPLTLTPRGRIYMDFLEESMVIEDNMRQRLATIGNIEADNLSVGGQIYAALHLLPQICGEFYRRYPESGVTMDMGSVGGMDNLFEKLKKKTLDLILAYDYDPKDFQAIPLLEERLVLVMHKNLPGAQALSPYAVTRDEILNGTYPPEKELEDLSLFRAVKFIRIRSSSNISQKMEKMLGNYKIAPYVVVNVKQIEVLYNLMRSGIGAVMVPDLLIGNSPLDTDDLLYFLPKSPHAYRTLYLLKKKNTKLNSAAEAFVSIAQDFCANR